MTSLDACPWIEPPLWWAQGEAAWADLLQQVWEEVGEKPLPHVTHLLAMASRIGQAAEAERVALAIKVLTEEG